MDGQSHSAPVVLAGALEAVAGWLRQSLLKLNTSKKEIVFILQWSGDGANSEQTRRDQPSVVLGWLGSWCLISPLVI